MLKINLPRFTLLLPLLAGLLLCTSCKDPVVEEVDPCEIEPCDEDTLMGKLDTLWTSPIKPDLDFGANQGIFVSNESVVYNFFGAMDYGLNFHNLDDGTLWKTWQEIPIGYFAGADYHKGTNRVILTHWQDVVAINASSGEVFQHYNTGNEKLANPFGQILGDFFYMSITNNAETDCKLVRTHINDFSNWETVYSIHTNDVGGSRPNIQSYNLWTDPQTGDEILVFQHRMAFPGRVDVVAWNMTKGELLWKHDDIEPHANSSTQQIFIHDNKAYFQGQNTVWCFNLEDGEVLWYDQYLNPIRSFILGNFVYGDKENLIFIKADGDLLLAYDPDTGNKHYSKTGMGIKGAKLSYHDGILYYNSILEISSNLIAVRALTGQILWSEKSNLNYHSKFDGPIAIDPERGVLYASDRYYLMAIKLYED